MIAYHGDPAIKEKYVDRMRAHRLADELVHLTYWSKVRNRGCAVGCTLHSAEHRRYETELGIPEELAHLEESIFEGDDRGEWVLDFPLRFLEAIPVGADLSGVFPALVLRVMRRVPDHTDAVRGTIGLLERVVAGETVGYDEWEDASPAWWSGSGSFAAAAAYWICCAFARDDLTLLVNALEELDPHDCTERGLAEELLEMLAAAPVPQPVGVGS